MSCCRFRSPPLATPDGFFLGRGLAYNRTIYLYRQLDTKYQFGGFHDTTGEIIQCCGSRGQHVRGVVHCLSRELGSGCCGALTFTRLPHTKGYASTLPEMHASFLINGPRIKANNKIGMVLAHSPRVCVGFADRSL